MRPTIRQLEYASALAGSLHFRQAAATCGVTQPALSLQLKKLEELLGVRLFTRNRRRVVLTAAGARVVARARRMLASMDDLVSAAREQAPPLTGRLRMGVVPTLAPYLLPRILPEVRAAWPELKLLLCEDRTASLLEGLTEGRLDVLLLASPVPGEELASFSLFKERLVLVVPEGDVLAEKDEVERADLAGRPALFLTEDHRLGEQAREILQGAGVREEGDFRATSLTTLVQMVANRLGIALLPALAVAAEVRPGGGVVTRPLTRPAPSREIHLVWRDSALCGGDARHLGRFLREATPAALSGG